MDLVKLCGEMEKEGLVKPRMVAVVSEMTSVDGFIKCFGDGAHEVRGVEEGGGGLRRCETSEACHLEGGGAWLGVTGGGRHWKAGRGGAKREKQRGEGGGSCTKPSMTHLTPPTFPLPTDAGVFG